MNPDLEMIRIQVSRLTRLIERTLELNTGESAFARLVEPVVDLRPDLLRKPKAVMGGRLLLEAAKSEMRRWDVEEKLIPREFREGPAWFILIFLLMNKIEGRCSSITDACSAARAPETTALRWVGVLVERGWCVRDHDLLDKRRSFITLSDNAYASLAELFEKRRVGRWRAALAP